MTSPEPLLGSSPSPESEPLLFAVLCAAASAVVAVSPDGIIVFANPAAERMFGYPKGGLLGAQVEQLVGGAYSAHHAALRADFALAPVARSMGTHDGLVARRRDGTELDVEVALTPLTTADGPWVLASVEDVTEARADRARIALLGEQYRLLASANQAIVRANDEDELMSHLCRVMVEDGGFSGAGVARPTAEGGAVVAHGAGWMEGYAGRVLAPLAPDAPAGNSPTMRALRDGEYVASFDIERDPAFAAWAPMIAEHGLRMGASLPLRRRGQVVAALSMYASHPLDIDPILEDLLQMVGTNVGIALEGLDARSRWEEAVRELSRLLRSTVASQDEERAKIAGDLHDESVQQLAAVDLHLGLLRRRLEPVSADLAAEVVELREMVSEVTHDLRELLFELEPADQDVSLLELVRRDAAHILGGSHLQWSVVQLVTGASSSEHPGDVWPVTGALRTQVVRIIKEGLRNALRHARAKSVDVRLDFGSDGLEIVILDDGIGLEATALTSPAGHRGLTTMRDRAALMGGTLEVTSEQGATSLRVWVPRR